MDRDSPCFQRGKYALNSVFEKHQRSNSDYDRLNAYIQRNRHTPIYGDKAPTNTGISEQKTRFLRTTQESFFAKPRATGLEKVNGNLKNDTNGNSTSPSHYLLDKNGLKSTMNCMANFTADDYGFKRTNSFLRGSYKHLNSYHNSRNPDSSVPINSPQLLSSYNNSHSSCSSKSSTSFSKSSEDSNSSLVPSRELNHESPKNIVTKNEFKAFSSIVNHSQTPSPSATSIKNSSASSQSPSPLSTSNYRRQLNPPGGRFYNTDQDLRSLIKSHNQPRPISSQNSNGQIRNQSGSFSSSYSSSANSPIYSRHNIKASSCSPHHTPSTSLNYKRDRMAKHLQTHHDRNLVDTESNRSVRHEDRNGYALSKSSSSKSIRNFTPYSVDNVKNGIGGQFSRESTESPKEQTLLNSKNNCCRSYSNLSNSSYNKNSSRSSAASGTANQPLKGNYMRPVDATNLSRTSVNSKFGSPRQQTSINTSVSSCRTPSDCSVGQYSRINLVKRNHSFCNDSNRPSRNRRLTNLSHQASGSQQDIYDNHKLEENKISLTSSTSNSGFHLFGNIFNKNIENSKQISKRRVKSPPLTLEIDYGTPYKSESTYSSNYALPVSQRTIPKQNRQQTQTCTINLQDAYPLISPIASARSKCSVTESIKSQSSTLLSRLNVNSPTGSTVTPPNVGFDLEALLKIDDLRSWIQELETSRAKGYQTLYSDYEDCETDEALNNGDITQKGYEKKRARLIQPYLPKDQERNGVNSGGGVSGGAGGMVAGGGVNTSFISGGGLTPSISTTAAATPSSSTPSGSCSSASQHSTHNHNQLLPSSAAADPNSAASKRRRLHRRVTRNESRYHSEVRQEAVKEALAQYQSRPKNLPLPSKRASVTTARSPDHHHHDSDSEDSDDDSITAEGSLGSGHSSGHTATPDRPSSNRLPQSSSTTPPHSNHHHGPPQRQLPQLPSDSPNNGTTNINNISGSSSSSTSNNLGSSGAPIVLPRSSNNLNNPVLLPPPTMLQHPPGGQQQQQQSSGALHHHQGISSSAVGGSSSSSASPPPPPLPSGGSGGRRTGGSGAAMPQQGYFHQPPLGGSGGVSSIQQQPLPPVPPHSVGLINGDEDERRRREVTEMTDLMRNITTYCDPPDVTQSSHGVRRVPSSATRDDRLAGHYARHVTHTQQSLQDADWSAGLSHLAENWRGTGRWKVSNKIQQLLNTLKRPKRRPLPEFYVDDEEDLEIAANPKDPNAPKPEGMVMTPSKGETLVIPAGLPRSVEAAVERYGASSGFKAPVATVLDANNKLSTPLTYGKLLSRSHKMAYNLLSRLGGRGEGAVTTGDRVALVYPNCDPVSFMCALYACLQAGLVPVPIEVPLSRRDAGSQQIGFLLGSCGVSVALTSEACFKGLPKSSTGEVVGFKGWPKLSWFITDHLQKPPKEWQIPPRASDDAPAYIEYSTDCDGSVKGIVVNRSALLNHCRSLTSACSYTEGEVAVCVLDFKRDVGLWHSMFCSVFNGMHVVFIPYSVMKVNPASWMHMITKYKASIAIVKSRDLHWGLLATKDHKDISLHSLRLLLVADGANPWSLSSCDQFLSVFQSKGLRPDAICPCAASPQALTVSVRRPGHGGSTAVGRGVLSMQGLSYGVVRVDQDNSLTSLTLQDCGQVMPGAQMLVVRVEGPAYTCRTDEVGEICVSGDGVGNQYWGLPGKTNHTFRVVPLPPPDEISGTVVSAAAVATANADNNGPCYVRTGLLGFLGPGGLVFVCGSRDGLMTVTGRKHNTDDIIATVLAVEPMKFIFRGRIAVFSHRVLRDERICVIAEQRPECSEEESFQWMSRVLQAVDSIHQVGIYCLALVPPNHLPKTPLGGIHLSETKKRFLEGCLHPANVLMCPHACVTNLPKPREVHHDVGPASVMVGNLVQGNRLAMAQGRDIGLMDDEDANRRHPQFISDILKWRANTTENHEILTLLNSKGQVAVSLTCSQLHKKAERVGVALLEKGHINTGDHVALIYPPGVDLIAAFYGCLYVGAVPVTIRPPHPQNLQSTVNTVRTVVEVSKSVIILSTMSVIKLLKSKEEKFESGKKWPNIVDTDDLPKKRLPGTYRAPTAEMIAYLDFSVSTTGMLAGIKLSHAASTALCLSMKVACELYPSRVVALCLDPYCGLGLALWVLSSVYSGHQSILIPPGEVEVNPALWLTAVSQYKVRDTFCSYGVMELCTKGLSSSIPGLKQRGVNLSCVRTCIVVAEERPRIALTTSFSKLFNGLGLSPRAVSTSFGCRVNVAVCLQGASSPDPSTVYVDLRSLRHDRVTLVERGAPHSLCLMESGKLLPGAKVVIANPETKGHCSDSHLGEIWVQSNHNSSGYFTVYGDDGSSTDHFNSELVTGNTGEIYARTGCLGFLKRTESVQADGELHDAVFVVGSLDETVMQRGMRYHPIDIENTVMRCHKKISECAVFSWTNLLVVVVELDGQEYEALDLVPLITSAVVENHQIIVGVIVVVDPGVVPINSRGEKQRMHLRDGFLADQLDPIYVAYNM